MNPPEVIRAKNELMDVFNKDGPIDSSLKTAGSAVGSAVGSVGQGVGSAVGSAVGPVAGGVKSASGWLDNMVGTVKDKVFDTFNSDSALYKAAGEISPAFKSVLQGSY